MIDFIKGLWEKDVGHFGFVILAYIFLYAFLYVIGTKITNLVIDAISKRFDEHAIHWKFIKRVIKCILIFIVVLGVSSSVPILDKFVTTIIASSAVIVAAVGLASQESIANVASGMFISIFKPFAVGDRIKLISSSQVGRIEDINLRHTVIRTVENNRIIIPNTTMNKEIVENSNYEDGRICNFLDVKITYESDIQSAKDIMTEEILKHPCFIDWRNDEEKQEDIPLANVMVRDITSNCIELRVGVWTVDIGNSFQTCSDLRESIVTRFQSDNIKLYCQTIRISE